MYNWRVRIMWDNFADKVGVYFRSILSILRGIAKDL